MNASAYLSSSNGAFRVIYKGLPICADKRTAQEALAAAAALNVGVRKDVMWDGDAGEFVEVQQ